MAEQPDERIVWTGKLHRGEQEGTVAGWLFNAASGQRIEFRGSKDLRPAGGYLLVGKRQPAIDGER